MTTDVQRLKDWAIQNYERGADTFVECWVDQDYQDLLDQEGSFEKALEMLDRLRSIYEERQADARFHRES